MGAARLVSAPKASPCSSPPVHPLSLPLPCQRLCSSSAHIAPLQLIKTKSKHLLLALSAFLPAWRAVGWAPTSVLLPPAWEGLAAGGLPLLLGGQPGVVQKGTS